jgi:pimeloyl-ACP methyl ester carboxylesterase
MSTWLESESHLAIVGAGSPLVMIPGMDATGRLFYRQAPLLGRRYRVATYATRDSARTMGDLVGDLDEVLSVLAPGGEPVTVFGESFGGGIALSYALERPERVAELVLLNTFPWFGPQRRLRLANLALRMTPWNPMPLLRRWTARRLRASRTGPDDVRRFIEVSADTTLEGYRNRLRILRDYDVRPRLHEIRARTLLIAAEEDRLVPSMEQARLMAARIADATLVVLRGHGHECVISHEIDLGAIVGEWSRVTGSGQKKAASEA